MSPRKLNDKQEKFAQLVATGLGISEAYKECWSTSNMKEASIHNEAYKRSIHPGISERIVELKAEIMEEVKPKLVVTVESILEELEQAKQFALDCDNPTAYRQSIMDKFKVAGLDVKKIEHTGKDGGPIESASLTAEEFKALRQNIVDDC